MRLTATWVMVCASACLSAQSAAPPSCAQLKSRFAATVAAAKTKPDTSQFSAYLKFLTSVWDDPQDCVTSDVRAAISRVERNLISLRLGDKSYTPEKIIHCNEIDSHTLRCSGAELDDAVLGDETALLDTKPALPKSGEAIVNLPETVRAEVVGLFAEDRSALQDGRPPAQIPMRGRAFALTELQKWAHPSVILVLRFRDALRFRKCVWLF